ncbi:MAG: ABC transporter ATP-binding protein [Candidatus Planktophila sp.]|nr:ABC transporter ATP-binding protein [Candidatus Planktophila sp.]MSO24546.1 ABC transporter ATP-binding protein [Candidatus Planktophila sp.]PHX70075.1 MAG: ABC transporter ATP-binding protein [Actinomycetota bacterium]
MSLSDFNHEHAQHGIAVSVRDLGLTYTTSIEKKPTLKARFKSLGRGKRHTRIVPALTDVNIDVHYGAVLGIIGSNGAGKSTLMRVISGIIPPSQGRVEVYGSVSTLLALGVGFNPSMTGRDNVYLGGLAAGMSREEIDNHFDAIADFSELGEAIDAPMRTYSSGMFARLAFSVAAVVEPDILIIDEALSTGDAKFKEKSLNRIKELRSADRALILVSHALATIEDICNEVIWLNKGKLMMRGNPPEVINAYREFVNARKSASSDEDV